ncbi:MAG: hypothetical protein MUO22_05815 [Sedimentisphaerales bacterium]|nr:hypothetical protein [Sedimentisphaerales bacterium]
MKKLLAVFLAVTLIASLGIGVAFAGNGNGNGGVKPGTDFSGPHFNLNIIGKKADWKGGGEYNNPDRHTIFVPEYTEDLSCTTPNGLPGATLWITQGEEFAVFDGNAFDDCEAAFQLGAGKYKVYIVAKAKPGKYTDITGWVYAEDDIGGYYYLDIGSVHVTKSNKWNDATHIFLVSDSEDPFGLVGGDDMWVFDYMDALETDLVDPNIVDTAYFWQFDNHGIKLVKVRFYPV